MLKLETLKQCLWRNSYAPHPVLAATVSLADAFGWTTERLPKAVLSALEEGLPALARSSSLDGAEFVAHIAQRIQLLGDVATPLCGVASRDQEQRRAVLFFSARDFTLAAQSLSRAVQIVDRLIGSDATPERVARLLESCREMVRQVGLEPTTLDMVRSAMRQGVPWMRLSPLVRNVQLGQGCHQQRLLRTLFSNESGMARDYAKNKSLSLNILSQIRLPVGRVVVVKDVAGARKAAEEIGYPLVLKPLSGHKGDSVYVDLRDDDELSVALSAARIDERQYLLQSFFTGDDHRLMVADGKLVAAVRKDPAAVTGDGRSTIAELVERENRDPARIEGVIRKTIHLTGDSDRILARQGCTRATIPEAGRVVRLMATANFAKGATLVDVMERVHPDNGSLAVRATQAIGLKIGGVDFICPDISQSWHDVGGGICEVNTAVGLHPELRPGAGIDVRDVLLQTMYPAGDDGRIPTAMVTGTIGKTTTSMMLASILTSAGHVVGCATSEGVRIGTELVERGDLASADGASVVLRDPMVTAAVLETARGGLVKTGMYLDRCDVAALLNVQRDQIEMDGVETLDDMLALKRKAVDAARKAVVLNADDPRCLALAPEFSRSLKTVLFSRDAKCSAIRDHVAHGGDALFLDLRDGQEVIVVASDSCEVPLLATADVPATHGGLIWPNGSNAMAAAALAIGLGVELETIRGGLRRYGKEFSAAAFRMFFAEGFPLRIMFDSSGKPPGYAVAVTVTDAVDVPGRRICVVTIPGTRPDWAFTESASALAGHFDHYICYEREDYLRGRNPGEIAARFAEALIAAGVDRSAVSITGPNREAAERLAEEATADDFAIVFGVESHIAVEEYRRALRAIAGRA